MPLRQCFFCGYWYSSGNTRKDSREIQVFRADFRGCPNCGATAGFEYILPEWRDYPLTRHPGKILSGVLQSPFSDKGDIMKHFDTKKMPEDAVFTASSPVMTDTTVPPQILQRHMAPKGKTGKLVVLKGTLQFVWEDTGEILDADPEHPVLIDPERFHHVSLSGPAEFRVEFYEIPATCPLDETAVRPGEQLLK